MPKIIEGMKPTTVVSLEGRFAGNDALEQFFASEPLMRGQATEAVAQQDLTNIKPGLIVVMHIIPERVGTSPTFSVEPQEDWLPAVSTGSVGQQ